MSKLLSSDRARDNTRRDATSSETQETGMDTARSDLHVTTPTSWWGHVPSYHLPSGATWEAFALAQAEALTKGAALWNEMWVRVASAKSPLDYAVAATLMWPDCASQTMLYCKRLSDLVSGAYLDANGSATIPQSAASPAATHAQTKPESTSCPPADNHAANARPYASRSVKRPIPVPQFRGE
jgi:hypothetical protein